jgi:hypothetical protein
MADKVPLISINSSEQVYEKPESSWKSKADRAAVQHLKKIVVLASDVTSSVNLAVQSTASGVLQFKIFEYFTPSTLNPSYFIVPINYSFTSYHEYFQNIKMNVNTIYEKVIPVSQAIAISRSEIWDIVFTETDEEMADVEARFWDGLKVQVWKVIQALDVASTSVDVAVQTWDAYLAKVQNVNVSSIREAWNAASAEERKAFQEAQAVQWDEQTAQAWCMARIKISQISKDWNTLFTEGMTLAATVSDTIDAVLKVTVEAFQIWKKAYDGIMAAANAKNPGTQTKK